MSQPYKMTEKIQDEKRQDTIYQGRPTISLCMIVKNEEEFLDKCLRSVYDFVDEIIVVDTGSEDNTVTIAEKYTDKIYYHPWENSFSKARNQALQYASCDWVFQIDGDEELIEDGGKKLHEAVRLAGEADIIYVTIISSYSGGTKTASHNFERLFRNNGVIHYEGAVHNRIVGGSLPYYSTIELIHHGYDVNSEKYESKFKRTTDLLKQEISDDPLNPLHHHYLGVSYLSMGMDDEAKKESELAVALADSQRNHNPIYLWAHFNASMANYRLGNMEKARELALKSYKKADTHLDSNYMLTVISAEKNEWQNVISFGEKYLTLLHEYETDSTKANTHVNNTMQEKNLILSLIGHAHYFMKNDDKMRWYYDEALKASDKKSSISALIGSFHLDRTDDMEIAGYYIFKASQLSPVDLNIRYVLAKYYNKSGSLKDEKQCLEWLFNNGNSDTVVFKRLVELCIELMEYDFALEVINKAMNEGENIFFYQYKKAEIYRRTGDYSNAIESYMKILEGNPESGEIWNELGNIFFEMGDLENSETFLHKASLLMDVKVIPLVKLCEIYIRKNLLEDLLNMLNHLINYLDIKISLTINNMDDLFSVFNNISSAFEDYPEYSQNFNKVIELFKTEYGQHLTKNK